VLVRAADDAPKGNRELLKRGARPLAAPRVPSAEDLAASRPAEIETTPAEQELFAFRESKPPGGLK